MGDLSGMSDEAIEAACNKFADFGIDFRCPWNSDLDDLELERFEALRAAFAAACRVAFSEIADQLRRDATHWGERHYDHLSGPEMLHAFANRIDAASPVSPAKEGSPP